MTILHIGPYGNFKIILSAGKESIPFTLQKAFCLSPLKTLTLIWFQMCKIINYCSTECEMWLHCCVTESKQGHFLWREWENSKSTVISPHQKDRVRGSLKNYSKGANENSWKQSPDPTPATKSGCRSWLLKENWGEPEAVSLSFNTCNFIAQGAHVFSW